MNKIESAYKEVLKVKLLGIIKVQQSQAQVLHHRLIVRLMLPSTVLLKVKHYLVKKFPHHLELHLHRQSVGEICGQH